MTQIHSDDRNVRDHQLLDSWKVAAASNATNLAIEGRKREVESGGFLCLFLRFFRC